MTITCEACGVVQPPGSEPGGFCCQCGQPVRAEAWCPWCARRAPGGGFCRKCGCGLVPASLYGAARMLKAAGVDRLSLGERLERMPPEQVETFRLLFEEQRAVVERCVDEVRLCERFLVGQHHAKALEDALLPRLPLSDDELEGLRAPRGAPLDATPETLAWLVEHGRVESTRRLAVVALFRVSPFSRDLLVGVCRLLGGGDDAAREAALVLASWRLWRPGPAFARVPWFRSLDRAWAAALEDCGSIPGAEPWMAVGRAMQKPDGPLEPGGLLEASLASADADLALSAALALGPGRGGEGVLTRVLGGRDAERRMAALYGLAWRGSPTVAPALLQGPDEERELVLRLLRPPVHASLVEPCLVALERGGGDIPRLAVEALQAQFDEEKVLRVLPRLLREGDVAALEALMRVPALPRADDVVVGIFEADLQDRIVYGLDRVASEGLLSAAVVARLLARPWDPAACRRLLRLAEKCLERAWDGPLADEVVRVLFRAPAVEARDEAACVLRRLGGRGRDGVIPFSLHEADVLRVFAPAAGGAACALGAVRACLESLSGLLQDEETTRHVILREWVAELLSYRFEEGLVERMAEDGPAFAGFLASLAHAVEGECAALRGAAVRVLWMMSRQGSAREAVLGVVRSLRGPQREYDLTYWLDRAVEEPFP